ncbi:hypothetical protein ABZ234_15385 [Nocardiopsis sp. NPDC006198]|uniref:hypothetical protein n=1 Tax=Nocardiopsis sp. NPDC006198 TaxID=3154472 RepID=UPI0033B318DD
MFHQHASHRSALPSPERVLTSADYGWEAERERSFAPSRAGGPVPGRVVRAERGLCDVVAGTGPSRAVLVPPAATGDRLTPRTGDRVAVLPATASGSAVEDGRLTDRRPDSCHRLLRENAHAASRTDARLRAEMNRQAKQGARLRRAIKQSPNFKA